MPGEINNNNGLFKDTASLPFMGGSPINSKYTILPSSLRPGPMATTQPLLKGTIKQEGPGQNTFKSKVLPTPKTDVSPFHSVYSNPLSSMTPNPLRPTNSLLPGRVINPKDL